jgi:uncharacterized protein YbjT (DUF2867 family)
MTRYLVTGGTGHLGRHVVDQLRARAGHEVRVLSRREGAGTHRGDLRTGEGIADAVAGIDVVVHCAMGRDHATETRTLVEALRAEAGDAHLVFVSIQGIEQIPFFYYRAKLAAERVVESSGIPFTTLRTVQFHSLIASLFDGQRPLPVLFAPAFSVQPIDEADVARLLVDAARRPAAGRLDPVAGPVVQTLRSLAEDHAAVRGWRRPIVPLRLPGRIFRGYRAGHNLVPENAYPGSTYREYLESLVEEGPRRVS